MINEKVTMKSESVFSDDKNHRYLLRKEWEKSKDRACILMIHPNSADSIVVDLTTQLVVNNLSKLDYGSVDILNLYSMVGRLSTRAETEEAKIENIKHIHQAIDKCTTVILAYGAIGKSNKTVQKRINELLSSFESYRDKIFFLSDGQKESLYHPLVPSVRNVWHLIPYFNKDKK